MGWEVTLCGPLRVMREGEPLEDRLPGRQGRMLLAYLVLHRTRAWSRLQLVDALWGDAPPAAADAALSALLSKLRNVLGPDVLQGRTQLRLSLADARVDVELAAAEVAAAEASRDPRVAAEHARAALASTAAPLLPDIEADWADEQRRELESLRLRAHERLAESLLRIGGPELGAAERAARAAVASAPFRESAHRLLMEVLEATGNHAEALRVHEGLRQRLIEELGTAPGPDVRAVHERLLRAGWEPSGSDGPRRPFVGRDRELRALQRAWRAGGHRLIVITGEPGIGKTTLAEEFARRAPARVLRGRCDEEPLGPYQPFVAMRPEIADLLLAEAHAPLRDPLDADRARRFDAVARSLGDDPLLMIVEDLQWADGPTLRLLRHLVGAPVPARLLVLATWRDGEQAPEADELCAALRREGLLETVALEGLEPEDVGRLAAAAGVDADAAALHERTEGNPFFVEEVLGAAGKLVPAGVRELTAHRMRRLPEGARSVLIVAAVAGREFEVPMLERLAEVPEDVLGALEEAAQARIVREVAVGRYLFTHALVREALLAEVSELRRARLHASIGAALELDDPAAAAHHFELAAPVIGPDPAIDCAIRAGRHADARLAWEDAAQQYRRALRLRELAGMRGDRLHCDLLLALGAAQERCGSDEAADCFTAAAEAARALGDAVLLAQAALGLAGPWNILGGVRPEVVEALEEALAALGPHDSPLRARVLARLAFELYYGGDPERRLRLSEAAVSMARRTRDMATLAACLDARHYALWRPETVDERLAVAGELCGIAARAGDRELLLEGYGWTVVDLLELGDIAAVDRQIEAAGALAEEVGHPLYLWWTALFRGMRAQLCGDFRAAERLAIGTLELGRRGQAENAAHYFAQQMFNVRREQGRLGEVEPAVRAYVHMYPAIPAWRCVLALTHLELGRPEEARLVYEQVVGPGLDRLPVDANWLIAVTLLAEICGELSDATRAVQLYGLLEPYAARNVVVGRAAVCNGSAARLLGILAATVGDWGRAEAHFEEAALMHDAMGARPWAARTQVACARMLLERGDDAAARELLADAVTACDELGMVALGESARALIEGGTVRSRT